MKKKIFAFCIATVAFVIAFDAPAQAPMRRLTPGGRPVVTAPTAATQLSSATDSAGATTDPKEAPALNWDATPVDIVFQTYGEQVA